LRGHAVRQHIEATSLTRIATATLAVLFATVMTQRDVAAAESSLGAKTTLAEIQIGLCAPGNEIVRALDLRPRGAPITVWQIDDSALTLYGRGVRLRLRVAADKRSVFTLKVADQDCAQLDPRLVPPGEGKCEYDVYGQTMAGAVSLNTSLDAKRTSDLIAGRVPPAQVLSPSQVGYLRKVVGMWPLPPEIRTLGPMRVRIYRTKDKLYDVDMSRLPAGERFSEISRKVPRKDASRAMEVMKADLSRAGIDMCADQSTQAVNKLRALLN